MFINYILPTIITLLLVALFTVVCKLLTKNRSDKAKTLPVIILWGLMVLAEIWKISYLIGKDGSFNPNRYPIVFCSLVMYAVPLFAFKENKFSNLAKLFTIFTSIVAVLLFFATQWQFTMSLMNAHSFFYHGCMLAISVYLLATHQYVYDEKDYFRLFLVIAGYIVLNTVLGLAVGDYISLFGPNSSYLGFLDNIFGFLPKNCMVIAVAYLLCLGIFKVIEIISKKEEK